MSTPPTSDPQAVVDHAVADANWQLMDRLDAMVRKGEITDEQIMAALRARHGLLADDWAEYVENGEERR